VWVEPPFGEAKQWHGMDKFRLRTLKKANIEAPIVAAVQNIINYSAIRAKLGGILVTLGHA
jgi:hypothetical protein